VRRIAVWAGATATAAGTGMIVRQEASSGELVRRCAATMTVLVVLFLATRAARLLELSMGVRLVAVLIALLSGAFLALITAVDQHATTTAAPWVVGIIGLCLLALGAPRGAEHLLQRSYLIWLDKRSIRLQGRLIHLTLWAIFSEVELDLRRVTTPTPAFISVIGYASNVRVILRVGSESKVKLLTGETDTRAEDVRREHFTVQRRSYLGSSIILAYEDLRESTDG
jgi:hypothetical protein